jgi:hypothetical protein
VTVSKQAAQKIETERFNLKKLNEGDVKRTVSGYNQEQVSSSGKLGRQLGHQQCIG